MQEENNNENIVNTSNGKGKYSINDLSVMIIMGVLGTLGWITMFSLGLLINSEPYRLSILKQFDWVNFIMSILTYTPTNIALLCFIAAFSGGCSSRLVIGGIGLAKKTDAEIQKNDSDKTDSHLYMAENPFSSLLRGLVVYLAFLAGIFVTNSNAFVTTTAQQYGQLAGVVSLFSFVVGYDPSVFRSLISLSEKLKLKQ